MSECKHKICKNCEHAKWQYARPYYICAKTGKIVYRDDTCIRFLMEFNPESEE